MALADMTKRQDLLAASEFLVLVGGGCTDAGKQGIDASAHHIGGVGKSVGFLGGVL